jgi:hypothetical protein
MREIAYGEVMLRRDNNELGAVSGLGIAGFHGTQRKSTQRPAAASVAGRCAVMISV